MVVCCFRKLKTNPAVPDFAIVRRPRGLRWLAIRAFQIVNRRTSFDECKLPTRYARREDMPNRKETDRIDQNPRQRSFQEECTKKSVDRDGFHIIYSCSSVVGLGIAHSRVTLHELWEMA